jgi:hypothetical protein
MLTSEQCRRGKYIGDRRAWLHSVEQLYGIQCTTSNDQTFSRIYCHVPNLWVDKVKYVYGKVNEIQGQLKHDLTDDGDIQHQSQHA